MTMKISALAISTTEGKILGGIAAPVCCCKKYKRAFFE